MKNNDWIFNTPKVYNNQRKMIEKLSNYKVKCKCGHTTILISKSSDICTWCGRKIYRSKKDEFIEKLKKIINKKNKEA